MSRIFQRYLDDVRRVSKQPLWGLFMVALLLLPVNAAYLWLLARTRADGLTLSATYLGRDFVNYWNGGEMALRSDVMRLYDIDAYFAWIKLTFHPAINQMVFSYPPNILPFLVPFGALPYGAALGLWLVLGLFIFWFTSFYRTSPARSWLSFAITATNASVLCNVLFGQLGFFLAGGFVGALRLLPTHPAWAGALMGLLTFKPQLGPLLVVALLMRREWTAITAAVVTTLAMAGFSIYIWGMAPWQYYFTTTLKVQASFLHSMEGYWSAQMTTPFVIPRYLGLPYAVSMLFQIVVSIAVLIATVAVLRYKDCPWSLQVAVIAFGATLLTPYLLAYDLALPVAALLWYVSDQTATFSVKEFLLLAALWLFPFAVGITLQSLNIPVIAVTMLACFAMLVNRALRPRSRVTS